MAQSAKRACSCDGIPRILAPLRRPIPGQPRKGCQGSSAVEQGTHKPLVGSSILPPGTITPSRPLPCLPCVISSWDVRACGSLGLGCGTRDKSSLSRVKRPCRVAPGFHSVSPLRASVAQLDRASDYGSEGSRFNSWRMRQLPSQALLDAPPLPHRSVSCHDPATGQHGARGSQMQVGRRRSGWLPALLEESPAARRETGLAQPVMGPTNKRLVPHAGAIGGTDVPSVGHHADRWQAVPPGPLVARAGLGVGIPRGAMRASQEADR